MDKVVVLKDGTMAIILEELEKSFIIVKEDNLIYDIKKNIDIKNIISSEITKDQIKGYKKPKYMLENMFGLITCEKKKISADRIINKIIKLYNKMKLNFN